MVRGHQGVRVDDVVVALAIHLIEALVVAAGHQGHVLHVNGYQVGRVVHHLTGQLHRGPGVLDACGPPGAVRLVADGAHVAAHAQNGAGKATLLGGPGDHFHRVALAHAAHVQLQLVIGKVNGTGLFVQHQIVDAAVLVGSGQLLHRGQLGVVRVVEARLPVVVPDAQHRAEGHVHLAAGGFVHLFGFHQQVHNAVIHRHRALGRAVVQIIQVGHALVVVVDIVQLVVFGQILMQSVHLPVPFLLAGGVADHGGHGVEHIIPAGGVFLPAGHGRVGAGRGSLRDGNRRGSGAAAAGQ